MANTYTQIYIHIVFAVQGRRYLIPRSHKEELCKYTTGIIRNRDQKVIKINCEPDHMHVFVGLKPTIALSDLVRDTKAGSSGFINGKKWVRGKFNWQEGFGAFSHSHSEIERVVKYIQNQEEHHRRRTFKEEYLSMLEDFAVQYDSRYLFLWLEDEEKDRPYGA